MTCPATTLAPGASTTCTSGGAHDHPGRRRRRGRLQHRDGHGQEPGDATVTSNSSHTDTPVSQTSNLKLVKKATVTDVNGDFKTDLGDTIAWTFQLTNTGHDDPDRARGHRPEGRRDHLPG